jgi:hypothetical protein
MKEEVFAQLPLHSFIHRQGVAGDLTFFYSFRNIGKSNSAVAIGTYNVPGRKFVVTRDRVRAVREVSRSHSQSDITRQHAGAIPFFCYRTFKGSEPRLAPAPDWQRRRPNRLGALSLHPLFAHCFVGVARAIALCDRLGFPVSSVRFKGTQPLSPDSTSCALAFDPSFPWEEVERSCRGQALIQSAKCLSWREPFYFFFFSCLGAE